NAGNAVTDVHAGLYGETDLHFTDQLPFEEVDVVFFCFGHGKSTQFLAEHYIPADVRIIDLAQDFRLANDEHDYVYGLPELNALQLQGAQHIANPGCFATCIQLALLPLASAGLLDGDVMVNAITGSTGAGVKPSATTHFSWRSGNMSIYKAFEHQHVPEILQSLHKLQPSFDGAIDFIPYRGDFPRGIFCTAVVRQEVELEQVVRLYKEFYADAVFTHYVDRPIDMKQVVGTNKCLVHVDVHGDKILVTSCIDNLLKGASGQAVQNMNLMFGLEENCGLQLKSLAF
ncbi:MAG: N-acetyl-gamma-glutamyl-phosphate reductase, partial [Bacteroidaceae bacterium]|nr:N-acetyl-gamma-glutamyl-phosphate reductase [Bacteroidaceae bacterium]